MQIRYHFLSVQALSCSTFVDIHMALHEFQLSYVLFFEAWNRAEYILRIKIHFTHSVGDCLNKGRRRNL